MDKKKKIILASVSLLALAVGGYMMYAGRKQTPEMQLKWREAGDRWRKCKDMAKSEGITNEEDVKVFVQDCMKTK